MASSRPTSCEAIDRGRDGPKALERSTPAQEKRLSRETRPYAALPFAAGEDPYRILFESNPLPLYVVDLETRAFLAVNQAMVQHYGYAREEFLAMTILDIRPPDEIPALLEYIRELETRLESTRLESTGIWSHRRRDGTLMDMEVVVSPIRFGGRPAVLALAKDVTDRRRAEASVRRKTLFMQLLQDVAVAANQAASVEEVLEVSLDRICSALGWFVAHAWLVDPERGELIETGLWSCKDAAHLEGLRGRPAAREQVEGPARRVLASGRTLWIADMPAEEVPEALRHTGVHAALALPVLVGAKIAGVLEFYARERHDPDDEFVALTSHLGAQVGRVLERAHAERALRDLTRRLLSVREQEQTRISREIHDELGQRLTAMRLDAAGLRAQLPKRGSALRDRVDQILANVDTSLESLRQIAAELRPPILEDLGLAAAIEWLVQRFSEQAGIRCDLEENVGDRSIDRDRAVAAFRIVQEALTNAARHARATRVTVTLQATDQDLGVEIRDNGRGITGQEIARARSLGLAGMRERALAWGGQVWISGAPDRGTTVRLHIPLIDKAGEMPS